MATFWEIAARSVSNLFSLYLVYLQYLFISRFGFKSRICLLIAPVPVHCFSITFRIAPDGMPHFAASHLGLFCLPMSHKKNARLIWVKQILPYYLCSKIYIMGTD